MGMRRQAGGGCCRAEPGSAGGNAIRRTATAAGRLSWRAVRAVRGRGSTAARDHATASAGHRSATAGYARPERRVQGPDRCRARCPRHQTEAPVLVRRAAGIRRLAVAAAASPAADLQRVPASHAQPDRRHALRARPTSPAATSAARPRAVATLGGRAGTAWRWARAKPWRRGDVVTKMLRRITSTIMIRICAIGLPIWMAWKGLGGPLSALQWIRPMGGCSPARRPLGALRAERRLNPGRRGSRPRRARASPETWAPGYRPGHTGRGRHERRNARRAARTPRCLRSC